MRRRIKQYRRMLSFLRPYLPLLGLSLGLSLLVTAFEGTSLWIIGTLADTLFNPNRPPPVRPELSWGTLNETLKYWVHLLIRADNPQRELIKVCFIFLASFFLKNIFFYIKTVLTALVNLRVVRDLRNRVYAHVLMLPVGYYDRNRSGRIMSIILNDVNKVNQAMTNTFNKLFSEPIRLCTFVLLLFVINWKMTLMCFIIYPFLIFLVARIGASVRRRSRRALENMEGLVSVLHETVNGIRAVKMFNMNRVESAKFEKENQRFTASSFRSRKTGALTSPLTETLGLMVAVSLLWYGGSVVLAQKGMTAEDFLRYLTLLIFSYQPIKALGGVNNAVQKGLAAADRVFAILDTPAEPLVPSGRKPAPRFENRIEYRHVNFTYDRRRERVLHDISFTVKKGEIVAFVGSSGSGKSTILDLLPRFYRVSDGGIYIDNRNVNDYDLVSLRNLFGIVAQETVLFNDTVFNNIGYGMEAPSEEKVHEAAAAANALEFIEKLPQKMNTVIGEKGVSLSGGQCQRLSIARALLRNPPILILDEATSALDTESEKLVQKAINTLMKNRTALVVAHRLSTIRHADHIVVLERGRIIEQGTHEQLLRRESKYKYFYDIQFAGVSET